MSGAGSSSDRPWRYSAVMGFLNPFMEDRPTSSNMGRGEALEDSGQWLEDSEDAMAGYSQAQQTPELQAAENTPVQRASKPAPRRKRPHTSDFEERLLTALEAVSNRPGPVPSPSPPPPPSPEDSDSYFLKACRKTSKPCL